MKISIQISSKHEPNVILSLFSDPKFFFETLLQFKIMDFENQNTFFVYGELTSLFSLVDIEAKVTRYISNTGVIYVLNVAPGLVKLPPGKELDRSFKPTPPKGNGKITITRTASSINVEFDYEGEREKMIVNSLSKRFKSIRNLDDIIWKERVSRHL
ncbi:MULTISPECIES: DUF3211 domain-containing protein [Metallosphaera]|uniref:DUF3211 domain-containing protein n=3 Tax=Metallosphaera TaxID=41980 RepID=A4YHZ4_METS5|nr:MULTISPECIES: DUF3211 domain-containing protein [Metallosphaera]ABP96046.1 hypothetical protein Msed_1906 [Metallosphaera sedula DSM 5348]AIM28030.1 hypothetical protein HA72_1906 [Metallosphaera sedula]AKV74863.1 hypothetical protein MsedA_1954 [Metallosphaera sedula]AKV77100.1 hypothetical protein MsedB_1956 [Metallosphaera sedula]AKV79351.1 hypothetical protein MsedC_1954 [Metallosphaera sedula]